MDHFGIRYRVIIVALTILLICPGVSAGKKTEGPALQKRYLQQDTERIERLEKRIQELEKRIVEHENTLDALVKRMAPQEALKSKVASCANNLRQLWALQTVYMTQFGGRMKAMPSETGAAFWIALTKTQPPLIATEELQVLVCPFSEQRPRAGFTTYRGPSTKVNLLKGDDPVGCCEPGQHKDGTINVLMKSGDVLTVGPKDALYDRALKGTFIVAAENEGDKAAVCKRLIQSVGQGLEAFEKDIGLYPASGNINMVKALRAKGLKDTPYFVFAMNMLNDKGEVLDPWGNPLAYFNNRTTTPGWTAKRANSFDLYSFGPNGKDDKGEQDDIAYH